MIKNDLLSQEMVCHSTFLPKMALSPASHVSWLVPPVSSQAFAIGGDEQSLNPEAKRVMMEIMGKVTNHNTTHRVVTFDCTRVLVVACCCCCG